MSVASDLKKASELRKQRNQVQDPVAKESIQRAIDRLERRAGRAANSIARRRRKTSSTLPVRR